MANRQRFWTLILKVIRFEKFHGIIYVSLQSYLNKQFFILVTAFSVVAKRYRLRKICINVFVCFFMPRFELLQNGLA